MIVVFYRKLSIDSPISLPGGENLTLTGATVNSHVIYYIMYIL